MVSKVFEKVENNRLVDLLEKCGFFLISSMVLGLLDQRFAVVPDSIAKAFNRSGATQAAALDISKAFNRLCHAGLLHKFKSYGISGQICHLISSFLCNRQFWVVLDAKSLQRISS